MSFNRNMGKNISKSLSSKYSQKLLDHAKQSAADALRTASKRGKLLYKSLANFTKE